MKKWEIVKAWEEGKEVEFRPKGEKGNWRPKPRPDVSRNRFYFDENDYRIKPASPEDCLVGRKARNKIKGTVFAVVLRHDVSESNNKIHIDYRVFSLDEFNEEWELLE